MTSIMPVVLIVANCISDKIPTHQRVARFDSLYLGRTYTSIQQFLITIIVTFLILAFIPLCISTIYILKNQK
jgi:hypothetical protein